MLRDLLKQSRTYRRFYGEESIPEEELKDLVDLTRLTPSSANAQALKFKICTSEEERRRVFENLTWAGALPDWPGPGEEEQPSAYILILCDLTLGKNKQTDEGIAAQTIMLGAAEKGYGGCIFASIRRDLLMEELGLDQQRYTLGLVLALGKPKEKVELVPVKEDGSVTYYRDDKQVHYVPKRSLKDILL